MITFFALVYVYLHACLVLKGDPLVYYLALVNVFICVASFPILLHSGLYSLKSTPFSKAKRMHYISFGIAWSIFLSYELLFIMEFFSIISDDVMFFMLTFDPFSLIVFWGVFASAILDIIGTILHKREQKHQLESADSQKTA